MKWRFWRRHRDGGVVQAPRSFVADVEWERSEELRPDRLGPNEDDVINPEPVRDPWRPSRTLGSFKSR